MSWSMSIKNATVSEAHAALLKSFVPEPIRAYVRMGIAGLAERYGDDVVISAEGHGHICDSVNSYEVTSATIKIEPGEATIKKSAPDPTVAVWVEAGYRADKYRQRFPNGPSTDAEIADAIKAQEADDKVKADAVAAAAAAEQAAKDQAAKDEQAAKDAAAAAAAEAASKGTVDTNTADPAKDEQPKTDAPPVGSAD